MTNSPELLDHFGGEWQASKSSEYLECCKPGDGGTRWRAFRSAAQEDVDAAVRAAAAAYPGWRRTPPEDRIQYLFKLKQLLEDHLEELARICTMENGKTLADRARNSPRHRERRSGLRDSHADAGLQPGRRRQRHRRDDDPPAAGRNRSHRAVQFPGDDSVLVFALRDCLRKHVHPEAVGKGAAYVAASFRADGDR